MQIFTKKEWPKTVKDTTLFYGEGKFKTYLLSRKTYRLVNGSEKKKHICFLKVFLGK